MYLQQVSLKRGRSPSPPPTQPYQYNNKMMAASLPVEKPHPYTHTSQPDYSKFSLSLKKKTKNVVLFNFCLNQKKNKNKSSSKCKIFWFFVCILNKWNEILIHIWYLMWLKTICFTEQQSNFPQSQAGPGYPTQSSHAFQQAGYVPSKSPVKYNPGSQSAFSSYSNPYAHQQTKQLQESGFPAYRMQQPGIFLK